MYAICTAWMQIICMVLKLQELLFSKRPSLHAIYSVFSFILGHLAMYMVVDKWEIVFNMYLPKVNLLRSELQVSHIWNGLHLKGVVHPEMTFLSFTYIYIYIYIYTHTVEVIGYHQLFGYPASSKYPFGFNRRKSFRVSKWSTLTIKMLW